MPSFGEFQKKQQEIKKEFYKANNELQADLNGTKSVIDPSKVSKISSIIGKALDRIGTYNQLNNKEQVVALIDEVGSSNFKSNSKMDGSVPYLATIPSVTVCYATVAKSILQHPLQVLTNFAPPGNVHQLRQVLHDLQR